MKKIIFAISVFLIPFLLKAQLWQVKSSNPNNPYDSIGYFHNVGLNDCKTQTGSFTEISVNYVISKNAYFDYKTSIKIANNAAVSAITDSTNYQANELSEYAKIYARDLIRIIDGIEDSSDIDNAAFSVRLLESDVMTSDLTTNEKASILCASSVARYSLYYWLDHENNLIDVSQMNNLTNFSSVKNGLFESPQYSNTESVVHEFGGNAISAIPDGLYKKGWLRRILHVVVGDVVGGLVGAAVGSLTGSTVGIFAGAFLGAMSGSLNAADSEGMLD